MQCLSNDRKKKQIFKHLLRKTKFLIAFFVVLLCVSLKETFSLYVYFEKLAFTPVVSRIQHVFNKKTFYTNLLCDAVVHMYPFTVQLYLHVEHNNRKIIECDEIII